MTDSTTASANETTLRAVFAAITSGSYDTIASHVTEDLHFELPYAPKGVPAVTDGRDEWDQGMQMTFAMFDNFTNTLDEIYPGADPDLIVAEYHSDATVRSNGKNYRNRYVGIFRFRDGKICAWKEFHDPRATSVLM